ncbi:hypothetical protein SARC_07203 [Sphaeroforma arctica JP610]|uniref:assimilatory sulfite reductase (NADPH) n=1 Tax=Sphaeroforma arctica JP610 TaxID=667725 RepID=A0A0L0FUC9_9EUKA|nr:hypothetical protein SARC_07203 [Sphaeroforma arctica JP610]KNC80432.1 hypothetical protein SARC_07203 [Sphaeroforma arctica JP610]|eukprot:XP_014154334.1 hypothetical protein SARC_07203 [Sphaeroforma arctica JP610]
MQASFVVNALGNLWGRNSKASATATPKVTADVAVAHVTHLFADEVFIFDSASGRPVLGGHSALKGLSQEKNSFDRDISVVESRNAAGSASALESAASNTPFTVVHTTSDNLLSLIPALYNVAEEKWALLVQTAPTVMANGVPLADHGDVMALSEIGFAIFSSQTTQEAHDLSIIAQIAASRTNTPSIHFFDGDSTREGSVALANKESLLEFIQGDADTIDNYKKKGDKSHEETAEEGSEAETKTESVDFPTAVEEVMKDLTNVLGHRYHIFEYVGPKDAEHVVLAVGTVGSVFADTISHSQAGDKCGVLLCRMVRPWSGAMLIKALPKTCKRIAVLDVTQSNGSYYGPLYLDVMAAIYETSEDLWNSNERPLVIGGQIQGSSISHEIVQTAFQHVSSPTPATSFVLGKGGVDKLHTLKVSDEKSDDVDNQYVKVLQHLFAERLAIANAFGSATVWGDGGKSTIEYGYGVHSANLQRRSKLAELVNHALWDKSIGLSEGLKEFFLQWLQNREDAKESAALEEKISELLSVEANGNGVLSSIFEDRELFSKKSRWLVGGDDWARDLSDSGVHHIISGGEDVNVLILDTQPYSHTSKNRHQKMKKDIGLYSMNYGGCYVASVALYSSYTQVLRACMEADRYPGPSVVLAYMPHVDAGALGISESLKPLEALKETKRAVDSGLWPLYRWNPQNEHNGKDNFSLDSERAKKDLLDFLAKDKQLSVMAADKIVVAPALAKSTETKVVETHTKTMAKAVAAYSSLLSGLSGDPVLFLYGSDGGNAEGVAKNMEREAKGRGLNARCMAGDEFEADDLSLETKVIFLLCTAGQGEFPGNFKDLWKGLQASDTPLNNTQYAIFGLGDVHYWPGAEGELYFCKPAKDLDERLEVMGGQRLVPIGLGDDSADDGFNTALEPWLELVWEALGVAGISGGPAPPKITDDDIKTGSNFLRGTILEGLADESTGALAERDTKLTKFHGIYQQDDRDLREERKAQGLENAFSFMIRVRVPGGVSTADQYLAMDALADSHANGTIKLTTRQAYQLHGVIKKKLKPTIQGINAALMDTLAACGDVNRNVMCNPNPFESAVHAEVDHFARELSRHLSPQTSAYHEIWLDKKMVAGDVHKDHEPLYGETYLPRKFKIAIAVPPNNDVDVYAHCLGYTAVISDGKLLGYNVSVGGGMGVTHSNKKTYPQIAKQLGFCTPEQGLIVGEKVMLVQRDHGERVNRKHARLKYTVDDHGIDWFREQVEERAGFKLEPSMPITFKNNSDRYGWTKGVNGTNHYCLFITNGRVIDTPQLQMKTALKEIALKKICDFRLTANQHIIFGNVSNDNKPIIDEIMHKYGIGNEKMSGLRLNSMACVALPTCALAMAESERYLPSLITKMEDLLEQFGLRQDSIVIRMTGCPNGCARPYMAEIAFVGRAPGTYNMLLGGSHSGERLNKLYRESVNEAQILELIEPIFKQYASDRHHGETFGDFVIRAGIIDATTDGRNFHENLRLQA